MGGTRPARQSDARRRRSRSAGPAPLLEPRAIDVHAHFVPDGFWEEVARHGGERVQVRPAASGGWEFLLDGRWWANLCFPILQDWEARLAEMNQRGVAMQVVSLSAIPNVTWAEPSVALGLAQRANDELAWAARTWPDRFRGWAALPLQAPELAVEELDRARSLGLVGAMVPSHVGDLELDDPAFAEFWETAERLRMPVFVHNLAIGGDPRIPPTLRHVIGAPMETTLVVSRLLFSGLLYRYPELQVLLTHGGGTLPYIIGRLDRGWTVQGRDAIGLPSEVLSRFWFDSVVHDERVLRFLIEQFGADRVVMGSDFPYAMGEPAPVEFLERAVPEEARELVLRSNARRLLGLGEAGEVDGAPAAGAGDAASGR